MVTKNVKVNNIDFILHKMDAIEQLSVASKLLPILNKVRTIFTEVKSEEDVKVEEIANNVMEALKTTNTEDLQFILTKFLEKTYINNVCVMQKGKIVQPELVELDTALLLSKEHFLLNFESYLKYLQ